MAGKDARPGKPRLLNLNVAGKRRIFDIDNPDLPDRVKKNRLEAVGIGDPKILGEGPRMLKEEKETA